MGKVCCYAAIGVRVYWDAAFTLASEDTLTPPGGVALAEVTTREVSGNGSHGCQHNNEII
jgi:hypothetical protein